MVRPARPARQNRRRRRSATELASAGARWFRETLSTPRRALFLVAGVIAFFTVAPILRYCMEHPYFAVRRIEIAGIERLDPSRVRSWLGMVVGRSMWRVSSRAVESELERHAEIAEARVRRVFPDRLQISLRERTPRALLHTSDGRIFLIDESGVVLGAATAETGDLPIISLPEGERAPERHVAEAVRVADLLERGVAGISISELALRYVGGEPEIVGYSDGGALALYLGWGKWDAKLAVLARVVEHESTRGSTRRRVSSLVGRVDLRDPDAVAAHWQPAPGTA